MEARTGQHQKPPLRMQASSCEASPYQLLVCNTVDKFLAPVPRVTLAKATVKIENVAEIVSSVSNAASRKKLQKVKEKSPKDFFDPEKKDLKQAMEDWYANGMDMEHYNLLLNLLIIDRGLAHIMTPAPVARAFAQHLWGKYKDIFMKPGDSVDQWRVSVLDPMTGTGNDALAMVKSAAGHVILEAYDIDPAKLKLVREAMKILYKNLTHANKDSADNSILKSMEPFIEHAIHSKDVSELWNEAENNKVSPVDILYLDPIWPGTTMESLQDATRRDEYKDHVREDYMIGDKEMFRFINHMFERCTNLKMVICKIYKEAWTANGIKKKAITTLDTGRVPVAVEFFAPKEVTVFKSLDGKPTNWKTVYGGVVSYLFVVREASIGKSLQGAQLGKNVCEIKSTETNQPGPKHVGT